MAGVREAPEKKQPLLAKPGECAKISISWIGRFNPQGGSMKRIILLTLCALLFTGIAWAQVGEGTGTPDTGNATEERPMGLDENATDTGVQPRGLEQEPGTMDQPRTGEQEMHHPGTMDQPRAGEQEMHHPGTWMPRSPSRNNGSKGR
jgi:hypothetical protein